MGHASRSLWDYKSNYAQIENETLSTVFAIKRFHEYLYGCKFTVINDHQPLQSIFSKAIVSCPPRIHKFFLKFSLGKAMLVSDALSRAYIKILKPEFDENNLIHHVHFVIWNLLISNERFKKFKEEIQKNTSFSFTRSLLFADCRLLFKVYCCRKFTKSSIRNCNQQM